jgi:hypothetical protein
MTGNSFTMVSQRVDQDVFVLDEFWNQDVIPEKASTFVDVTGILPSAIVHRFQSSFG